MIDDGDIITAIFRVTIFAKPVTKALELLTFMFLFDVSCDLCFYKSLDMFNSDSSIWNSYGPWLWQMLKVLII